jgi:hypothetical protein
VIIQRGKPQPNKTVGIQILPDGREFPTLEPPWRNNQVKISCVPAGFYRFVVDTTGRFQWFKILFVPKRTHIEMHMGLFSEGCVLMLKQGLLAMQEFYNDPAEIYIVEIRDYVEFNR